MGRSFGGCTVDIPRFSPRTTMKTTPTADPHPTIGADAHGSSVALHDTGRKGALVAGFALMGLFITSAMSFVFSVMTFFAGPTMASSVFAAAAVVGFGVILHSSVPRS